MFVKLKHIIEYVLLQVVGYVVRLLPLQYIHKAGFTLGKVAFPLLKSRRNVALRNLRNAFPELNESRREEIAIRSFQSVSAAFLELLWFKNMTKERIKQRVHIENLELLEQFHKKKKGIIFLTAHFGSWELAVQAISVYSNTKVYAIAKIQSNSFVDRLITHWREMFGVKIIPMSGVREILRALQQGEIVELAADQSAPKESVAVEFFGRKVPTFQGPAAFCLKTGAPIILGCTVRQEDGNYRMCLMNVPTDDLTGVTDENVLELTRRQVRMTEKIIRKYPEQWMWMHKRWKHVPDRIEIAK